MSLTLYLLRHGQTALSRDDVFCGSGLDPELTPEGLQMARAAAPGSAIRFQAVVLPGLPWRRRHWATKPKPAMVISNMLEGSGT